MPPSTGTVRCPDLRCTCRRPQVLAGQILLEHSGQPIAVGLESGVEPLVGVLDDEVVDDPLQSSQLLRGSSQQVLVRRLVLRSGHELLERVHGPLRGPTGVVGTDPKIDVLLGELADLIVEVPAAVGGAEFEVVDVFRPRDHIEAPAQQDGDRFVRELVQPVSRLHVGTVDLRLRVINTYAFVTVLVVTARGGLGPQPVLPDRRLVPAVGLGYRLVCSLLVAAEGTAPDVGRGGAWREIFQVLDREATPIGAAAGGEDQGGDRDPAGVSGRDHVVILRDRAHLVRSQPTSSTSSTQIS